MLLLQQIDVANDFVLTYNEDISPTNLKINLTMKKSYFLWSLLGLLTLQLGWAQQKTITGTVNDETGLPLPGATVVIDGTTRGVAADFDGNFSIQASEGETLVITYIGYADQRLSVGSQDSYTINLSRASFIR